MIGIDQKRTKVVVTGASGQLGRALCATCPANVELVALDRNGLDICERDACEREMQSHRPHLIINAAAYTAVDRAEADSTQAFAVNADAVGHLAYSAELTGARLIHVSTDYVFDGAAHVPWKESDQPSPLNVYGESKWRGERLALEILGANALIVRTAWLYDRDGRNFVDAVLSRMVSGRDLQVVCDQIGTPTSARSLASMIWRAAYASETQGILHWTDCGAASWYDVAVAVQDLALQLGLLAEPVFIEPVPTEAYPTAATRPRYSLLDSSVARSLLKIRPVHWRALLADELRAKSVQTRTSAN